MNSRAILVKLTLIELILLLATETNSALLPMPGCPTSCGNLSIPFPFGTNSDCNLDDSFLITCNKSYNPPKAFLNFDSIEVLDISLDGLMTVTSSVASDCYDESDSQINGTISDFNSYKFPISSTLNKFTVIGCDIYAIVEGSEELKQIIAGCVSWCDSIDIVVNGTCSGIGCCQTSIPKGVKDFVVDIRSFRNHTRVKNFNPCSYAFVVEAEAFEFSSLHLKNLQNITTVPVVLDWSVGNVTCQVAQKNLSSYACRAKHSECSDSIYGLGYLCNCTTGFEGNPYLVDGCIDIDECTTSKPCIETCTNFPGTYSCSCSEGVEGDGKKNGSGCPPKHRHPQSGKNRSILLYITSGFMISAVVSCWIFWRRKQKKLTKLRRNMFQRNGGLMLEKMLSRQQTLKVFTAEELKKATDNYDESRVLSRDEDFGIVYKGILVNERANRLVTLVTIENYGVPDEWQFEVFISKLVTFSQINHRNVLKLIGCCLETQVPVLVYEFISVKTLYDYIHDDVLASSLSWDIRLRIAAETAGALACFHSAEAGPIVHGNVNSSTILLHHGYTVKVQNFALRRNPDKSKPQVYKDMLGYLDPALYYLGESVKNDVYSFGVVLAEILTGKKVVSFESPQLVEYFVSSLKGDNLLGILDRRLPIESKTERLTEVAKLADKCLSYSFLERPNMEEVEMALKSAINSRSSSATTVRPNSSQDITSCELVRL